MSYINKRVFRSTREEDIIKVILKVFMKFTFFEKDTVKWRCLRTSGKEPVDRVEDKEKLFSKFFRILNLNILIEVIVGIPHDKFILYFAY